MHMQAYTVEQVAEMLSIGRDKAYYLLRTRQLKSIKIGKPDTKNGAPDLSETPSHLHLRGGRYWDRTSDLFGVNEALSR